MKKKQTTDDGDEDLNDTNYDELNFIFLKTNKLYFIHILQQVIREFLLQLNTWDNAHPQTWIWLLQLQV